MPMRTSSNPALYTFDAAKRAEHGNICGVDEAGRGPLCGPVCVAAVILNPDDPIEGVNDSKKLSEKRREALFDEIIARALCYQIVFISPQEIDERNILCFPPGSTLRCRCGCGPRQPLSAPGGRCSCVRRKPCAAGGCWRG